MKDFAKIVSTVIDNGLAATQVELENEFEFEATQQGWTDEEIKEAIDSPWFPSID